MGWWGWPVTALGAVMAIVTLLDVVLSVFHLDQSGPISTATQRAICRFMVLLSNWFRPARRSLLALIGPAALVATLFVWVGLFILAFAFLVWPHMNGESFSSARGLEPLGFVDASTIAAEPARYWALEILHLKVQPGRFWPLLRRGLDLL
jgi:hypothetical protein